MVTTSEPSMKELDEQALVRQCLAGSESAWEEVIRRYRRLIYSIPIRAGLGEEGAADVFQTVCLKLLEHLSKLKDHEKLASWIITTTNRESWRLSGRTRREAPIGEGGEADSTMPVLSELIDEKPLAEDEHIALQRQAAVRIAVDSLSERCRNLLELLYFVEERPSYEEVSRRMEMPVASIGPTRARCLEKLRKAVDPNV